jgi:hypothetical protein
MQKIQNFSLPPQTPPLGAFGSSIIGAFSPHPHTPSDATEEREGEEPGPHPGYRPGPPQALIRPWPYPSTEDFTAAVDIAGALIKPSSSGGGRVCGARGQESHAAPLALFQVFPPQWRRQDLVRGGGSRDGRTRGDGGPGVSPP